MGDTELTVHVTEDEIDGGFVASMPARPGIVGQGETPAAALSNLASAIETVDAEPSTDEKLDDLQAAVERLMGDGTDASVDDVARLFVLLGTAVGLARTLRAERDEARRGPVYVALIEDRHADPEPVVFSTPELAVEYARGWAQEHASRFGGYEERPIDGWLFHASYSPESDRVSVRERSVHSSLDTAMID